MKRLADLAVVVAFVALLALPVLNMVHAVVPQAPLAGVTAEKPRPRPSVATLRDESFQRGFAAWFDQAYGARPSLVRLDNTLDFVLFHETRPEKTVRVGKDGVLFHVDQLRHVNDRALREFADSAVLIARAREALRARGIFLELIVIPTKSSVWPGALPAEWLLPLGDERPSAVSDQRFRRELANVGVPFVDGNEVLASWMRDAPARVYARSARHATRPATCELLEAALARIRSELRDGTIPPTDCAFEDMPPDGPRDIDFDLHRLMDVWAPAPDRTTVRSRDLPERLPVAQRLPAMVVGSSFGWQFVGEADRNHLFRDLHFHYYGETMIAWGDVYRSWPVVLGSEEWKTMTARKKVILYVVPEEYLADAAGPFVREVIAAFGISGADGP